MSDSFYSNLRLQASPDVLSSTSFPCMKQVNEEHAKFSFYVSSKISARSQPISGVRLKYVSLTGNNDQGKMRSQSHLAKLNIKRIVFKVSSYLGDNCVKGGREGMNQNTEQEVALLQLQFASQKRLGKRERCSHEMRGR